MLRSHAMYRLVITSIVLAACAPGGPQQVGAQPSWRGGDASAAPARTAAVAGPVTFAPASEAASRYNEPLRAPPHTLLNDAVTAAVKQAAAQAGLAAPVPDARLFRACAELAEVVSDDGALGYTLIEFALQRNGIIEPSPRLLVVWGPIDSPALIVEQLQPRLRELLGEGSASRLGVGAARRNPDGSGAVVFALQGSGVTTSPIPRVLAAGGKLAIDAVLDPRYRDPEVFVTRDDGRTEQLELAAGRAGGFTSQVACGAHRGRQQIEITASDAAGSTVLANFPVWCADGPPRSIALDPAREDAPATTPAAAERGLLARLNRDRLAAGLAALAWDERLAVVARSHSDEMRRTHVVAHISPVTGSAADRVRAAHIKTTIVLENLARAYGVAEAHQGLMNSPGHRANLMSAAATHIGIGVAFGDEVSGRREMFVTQVFMRVPPKLEPGRGSETVRQKLTAARASLAYPPQLFSYAQSFVDRLAAGQSREVAYQAIKPQIDGLGRSYQRVGSVITVTGDLDSLDGASLLGNTAAQDVGIGIAQGTHPEIGDNAIWVVVLVAERRAK